MQKKKTDETKFDISLYTDILDKVYPGKYGELVGDLRTWRNQLFHKGDKVYAQKEFDKSWSKLSAFLQKHGFDLNKVNDWKTGDFFSNTKYILHIHIACSSFLQGNMKRVYFENFLKFSLSDVSETGTLSSIYIKQVFEVNFCLQRLMTKKF